MNIFDDGFGHCGGKDDDGADPEVERNDREGFRENEFAGCGLFEITRLRDVEMTIVHIKTGSYGPSEEERTEEERGDAAKDHQEGRPESHVCRGIDERKSRRHDDSRREVTQESKSGEILYRTSHLSGDDRRCRRGRHNEAHQQSLRENGVRREMHNTGVSSERQDQLRSQHDPMPFMQTQIEGVDLAERKKEHKEDPPRKGWLQGQKELITNGSDEH